MARLKRKRANKRFALERLLRDAPPIDAGAYAAFLREMAGEPRPKSSRR
jgi:hypothetical protein